MTKYQKRISSPLLDKIDIHIEVLRVDYEKLSGDRVGEPSECIRARVQAARDIQRKRFEVRSLQTSEKQSLETLRQAHDNALNSILWNADMCVGEIREFCKLPDDGHSLMWGDESNQLVSAPISVS